MNQKFTNIEHEILARGFTILTFVLLLIGLFYLIISFDIVRIIVSITAFVFISIAVIHTIGKLPEL